MESYISEDEFMEIYKPQPNPFNESAPLGGLLFETVGPELDFVKAVGQSDPGRVWTLLDCDGEWVYSSGFHFCNRMGYLLTEIAVPKDDFVQVQFEDSDEEEEDEE